MTYQDREGIHKYNMAFPIPMWNALVEHASTRKQSVIDIIMMFMKLGLFILDISKGHRYVNLTITDTKTGDPLGHTTLYDFKEPDA